MAGPMAAPNTSVIETWPSLHGQVSRRSIDPARTPPASRVGMSERMGAHSTPDWVACSDAC